MQHDRIVVVTGASAGIGKAAARMFAAQGWHVIGVGRHPDRTAAAEAEIKRAAADGGAITMLRGDLSEMAEVQRIADEIAALTPRIDVLVNNAGGVRDQLYVTADGLEWSLAANHLAPFLLTRALLPLLREAAQQDPDRAPRIIAVSSLAYAIVQEPRWDDLNMRENYAPVMAYAQAKLANILFTRELGRRLDGSGIVAQVMHPGTVDSNFASHGNETMQQHMAAAEKTTPEAPAETILWLATSDEGGRDPGRFFHAQAEVATLPHALDDAAAARLWLASEAMLAETGYR